MFYAYEVTTKVLVVENNLNDVQANKCEAYETLEDIPFHMYDYWFLPEDITREDIRNRIKVPDTLLYDKDPLTPPENEYGILIEG